MSEFNPDILEDNFIKPEQFYQDLNSLKSSMPTFLNNFKSDFINFNLNPQNEEYQNAFENDKNMLNNINNDTVELFKTVGKNTINLNDALFELNTLIKEAKIENKELKAKLGLLNNEMSASDELISDYKEMYNYGYLRNCGLVLCIIIGGIVISKVYPNNYHG
jgi:SMC interacting uncharacterized protein involved in chromosome segregation